MTVQPPAQIHEALTESVPILIGRIDGHGVIQEIEGSIPHADVLKNPVPGTTNLLELFPDDAEEIRHALDTSRGTRIEISAGDREKPGYFELRIVFDHKRSSGAYFLIHDITEPRMLQLALLDCTDREQMRVGQELHDTLGQELTGISYQLHALEGNVNPEIADRIWKLQERVASCLRHTRSIAFNLSPQFAGEAVCSALERLCAHMRENFDVECHYESRTETPVTDAGVSFHLFRIAQEACTNAMRHGTPTRIDIRLVTGPENLLEITDDGTGIKFTEPQDFPGMGMPMMKFRARAIGGTLRLQSRAPTGTVVRCRFENKHSADAEMPAENETCPTCL